MSQASMMLCDLCGSEATETLITRSRWQVVEADDHTTHRFCAACAEQHERTRQELLGALEKEERRAPEEVRRDESNGFLRRLLESVLGR